MFFDNRLITVYLTVKGIDSAAVLHTICFEFFGPGKKDDTMEIINMDYYRWNGNRTEMVCAIDRGKKEGFIEFSSKKIKDERMELVAKRKLIKFIPKSKERHGF